MIPPKHREEKDPRKRRAFFMTGIVLVALSGLIGQLSNLTLKQQVALSDEAQAQQTRSLPIFAPRGVIYDRNMEPLVTNRSANSVYIRYPYFNQPEVLQRLAGALNVPVKQIQDQVAKKKSAQAVYEPVLVTQDLTPQQYTAIIEQQDDLPGVEVQSEPTRYYPDKDLAAHILGYVGQISEGELSKWKAKGYIGGEMIGQTGLEAFYEDTLRGKSGMRQVEIDSTGQPLGETNTVEPQAGNSLVLTIDANLQRVAERALDWDMWRVRNTIIGDGPWKNAKAGAVVVMDVKTGAVLAMASRPAFDPNLFANGISEADYQKLQDPVLTPEINRAVQKAYQPGSTWKMMTSAAALTYGVISPFEKMWDPGVYDKAGNPKDWQPGGHGWVDMVKALQDSCDIYFYEMGYRLGIDRLVTEAKLFGFGSKTGVDLGGEVPGLLPDQATRDKLWSQDSGDAWGVGHTVSAAIGQIVQATPLQLARYTAALGNGGKVMQPYLVQKIVDAQGKTVKEIAPVQTGQVNLKPSDWQVILQGMRAVDAPGGTSDFAIYPLPGITTAGKTGSAENPPYDDYGFYVNLAPADNPQIAVAVVIEQAMHGSNTSAVARAIEAAYFHVTLPTYDPANIPKEFPNDLAGLRQKYRVVGNGQ